MRDRAAVIHAALCASANVAARRALNSAPAGAAWGAVVLMLGEDAAGVGYAGDETLAVCVPEALRHVAESFARRAEIGRLVPVPPAKHPDATALEAAAREAVVALEVLIAAFRGTTFTSEDAERAALELAQVCQADADALRQVLAGPI